MDRTQVINSGKPTSEQARQTSAASRLLQVRVRSVTYEAEDINSYELVHATGGELPPFTAGSHLDLHFRDGRVRQYSLCNDPKERHRYVIGVLRDPNGRGGSLAIFERVHAGRILTISEPRNLFPLAESAKQHLLLAGGIGVTPMMSMVAKLQASGADFTMHYCTRSRERTAFYDRLTNLAKQGRVTYHHDGGDPRNGLNIQALLANHKEGTHLYYCGPTAFMGAVKVASAHWPKGTVHFEYFTPPVKQAVTGVESSRKSGGPEDIDVGFQVRINSTGAVYNVPNDRSIIDVLRENGIEIPSSCEAGLCGTCRTRYLKGEPEHHDVVLDDEEKKEYVMVCCARSKSSLLVLDL